jgi:hypothetical protein
MISPSDNENQNKESKTMSEKPVSLSSLSLKEALEGLLKVEPKGNPDKEISKNDNSED